MCTASRERGNVEQEASIAEMAKKMYNSFGMAKTHTARRLMLCLALTGLVASCGDDSGRVSPEDVRAARESVVWSKILSERTTIVARNNRPSALIGIYAGEYLSKRSTARVRTALTGIDAHRVLLGLEVDSETLIDETYVLLQALGDALMVNVQDTLNQSADRARALDQYLQALQAVARQSQQRLSLLEGEERSLNERRRVKSREVDRLEDSLRGAIREKRFSEAGSLQEKVSAGQREVDQLDAREQEVSDAIDLFEDLLEVAQERIPAIQANREILVSGLKVVNVPGIENLGIVVETDRNGRRRVRRSNGAAIFGL